MRCDITHAVVFPFLFNKDHTRLQSSRELTPFGPRNFAKFLTVPHKYTKSRAPIVATAQKYNGCMWPKLTLQYTISFPRKKKKNIIIDDQTYAVSGNRYSFFPLTFFPFTYIPQYACTARQRSRTARSWKIMGRTNSINRTNLYHVPEIEASLPPLSLSESVASRRRWRGITRDIRLYVFTYLFSSVLCVCVFFFFFLTYLYVHIT